MNRMKEHEIAKIRNDLRKICQTFLNVYNASVEADGVWGDESNSTNEWLWQRIGMLERRLERLAPEAGPKYDLSASEKERICVLGAWCGLQSSEMRDMLEYHTTPLWQRNEDRAWMAAAD